MNPNTFRRVLPLKAMFLRIIVIIFHKDLATIISKEIYEASIPVKIKSLEREDWSTYLVLKIIYNQTSQAHGQILHIELTDETNL